MYTFNFSFTHTSINNDKDEKTDKGEKPTLSENLFDHVVNFQKRKNKHGFDEYVLKVNDEKLTFDIIYKLRESDFGLRCTQVHSFVDE